MAEERKRRMTESGEISKALRQRKKERKKERAKLKSKAGRGIKEINKMAKEGK